MHYPPKDRGLDVEKELAELPGLQGVAGREVEGKGEEGRYERREMETRKPERVRVEPPAYMERV